MTAEKFRLVTRSDFDGLVCAVLLRHLDMIDEITFVHPKDVQDGAVEITDRDILTNLPYAPAAHMVFDHHHSETIRNGGTRAQPRDRRRRAVGGPGGLRLLRRARRVPARLGGVDGAVDQADSAEYTLDGHPRAERLDAAELPHGQPHRPGPVPGLPDLQLPADDAAHRRGPRQQDSVERSWPLPDVAERVDLYHEQSRLFEDSSRRVCSTPRATWSSSTCGTRRSSTPATGS